MLKKNLERELQKRRANKASTRELAARELEQALGVIAQSLDHARMREAMNKVNYHDVVVVNIQPKVYEGP